MKNIFTSIWFLGLIIAVPTVILIPDIFSKYKISLMSRSPESTNEYRIYYKDLDGNGNKEKIISFKNNVNQLAFQHFNKDGGIANQLNFKYNYSPSLSHIFFGDVNQNNLQEVYGFTLKNDSLYLSWVEPYPSQNEVNNHQFISKIGTYNNGEMNFAITHFEITDVDNDKKNEILFSIEAGYSLTPRVFFSQKMEFYLNHRISVLMQTDLLLMIWIMTVKLR